MKEKIKILVKKNFYNIIVLLAILGAFLTFIIMEETAKPILIFFLIAPFFLAIIWFLSQDKQIREFKQFFNERFPFLGKALSVIFRIFVFLIFLFSIFIIIVGVISTLVNTSRNMNEEELQSLDLDLDLDI